MELIVQKHAIRADKPRRQGAIMRSNVMRAVAAFIAAQRLKELVCPLCHSTEVARERYEVITSRVQLISWAFVVLTLGWTVLDIVTLERPLWQAIGFARIILAAALLVLARRPLARGTAGAAYGSLAALFGLCIAFLLAANTLFWHFKPDQHSLFATTMYFYAPFLMAAGLGIFPLALAESTGIGAAILVTMSVALILRPEEMGALSAMATLSRLFLIAAIGSLAAMSQLRFLSQLTERSTRDALTHAFTRSAGEQLIALHYASAQRGGMPFSVLFFDVDRFKAVNDRFGHDAGDAVLRRVAQSLRCALRRQDILVRWGGEEFVAVLPQTDAAGASAFLRRLGHAGLGFTPSGAAQTASVGLAERTADRVEHWSALVELADQRMYAAKRAGRNRYAGPDGAFHQFVVERQTVPTSLQSPESETLPLGTALAV
jgi:diguanylate cyclase (GGDEF)-like protein